MINHEFYRYFIFYSVLVSWISGFLLFRLAGKNHRTISKTAASSKKAYLTFGIGATISIAFLTAGIFGYLIDNTTISPLFYMVYSIVALCMLTTAWIPDKGRVRALIHHWSAFTMSYLLLSTLGIIFVDSYEQVTKTTNGVDGNEFLIALSLIVLLSIAGAYSQLPKLSDKKFLNSQLIYYFVFQVALLVRVYVV